MNHTGISRGEKLDTTLIDANSAVSLGLTTFDPGLCEPLVLRLFYDLISKFKQHFKTLPLVFHRLKLFNEFLKGFGIGHENISTIIRSSSTNDSASSLVL